MSRSDRSRSARPLALSMSALLGACTPAAGTDGGQPPADLAAADLAMVAPADMASPCGTTPILGPQFTDPSAECKACIDRSCCDVRAACTAAPECAALRDCFARCASFDDTPCINACNQAHPNGAPASANFGNCRSAMCAVECANFACLGKVTWPDRSATRRITAVIQDYVDAKPIAGATIKVCAIADAACASPRATATTAMDGTASFEITQAKGGMDGYIEISGPMLATVLAFVRYPEPDTLFTVSPLPIYGFRQSSVNLLAGAGGLTFDPNRGSVFFKAYQCVVSGAPGVKATADKADGMSTTFYLAGSFPSTKADRTDRSGVGGIANLLPGPIALSTSLAATGTPHGKTTILARAGALSTVDMFPAP